MGPDRSPQQSPGQAQVALGSARSNAQRLLSADDGSPGAASPRSPLRTAASRAQLLVPEPRSDDPEQEQEPLLGEEPRRRAHNQHALGHFSKISAADLGPWILPSSTAAAAAAAAADGSGGSKRASSAARQALAAALAGLGWMIASSAAILLNKNLMTGLNFRWVAPGCAASRGCQHEPRRPPLLPAAGSPLVPAPARASSCARAWATGSKHSRRLPDAAPCQPAWRRLQPLA
jgi:hypothetical protein